MLHGLFGLRDEHFQAIDMDHAFFSCLQTQPGDQWIVDDIHDRFTLRETLQIHRRGIGMRIHADRRGVDDDLRITMTAKALFIRDGAAAFHDVNDDHLRSAFAVHDSLDGRGSSAIADDEHFLSCHLHAVFSDHVLKAGKVCVIAIQLASAVDHGVDSADGPGSFIQFIQIRNDILFIRNRDIDGFKIAFRHEGMKCFMIQRDQVIAIIRDRLMDFFGKAVGEVLPD